MTTLITRAEAIESLRNAQAKKEAGEIQQIVGNWGIKKKNEEVECFCAEGAIMVDRNVGYWISSDGEYYVLDSTMDFFIEVNARIVVLNDTEGLSFGEIANVLEAEESMAKESV